MLESPNEESADEFIFRDHDKVLSRVHSTYC